MATKTGEAVMINKHKVEVTNLEKIFWPDENITKGDVIDYYRSMADYILPHLKNRPLSLKRNPNGIKDKGFFHKDAGDAAPSFVKTKEFYSESSDKDINYIICNNEATLVYLANQGSIEINPWHSMVTKPDNPTYLIIDLDPSENNTFEQVISVAQATQNVLVGAGITGYCKTSGASGLHIYIPCGNKYTYDEVRIFAEALAKLVHKQLPGISSLERSLKKRGNKIYIDYMQNAKGQTVSVVYCIRPVKGATVSMPLHWSEVETGLNPGQFTIHNALKRVKENGDLFLPVISTSNNIVKATKLIK